jgi:hypothetical protein
MARLIFAMQGRGASSRFENINTITCVDGVATDKLTLGKVFYVSISQNTDTPVEEAFGWTFDKDTKTLTITSSNGTSTATIQYHAIGY